MQYLETRIYNNGEVNARLWPHRPVTDPDDHTGIYNFYIETIGTGGDFDSLAEWLEEMNIELDDITALVLGLEAGNWMEITPYI